VKDIEVMPADGSAPGGAELPYFQLRLYIAGQSEKSISALRNLRHICKTYFDGNFDLEVIDLLQQPKRAVEDQILAIPTLVRSAPEPAKRIVGDLSYLDKVIAGLNIVEKDRSA
jgi:circadian clock protein KaiB